MIEPFFYDPTKDEKLIIPPWFPYDPDKDKVLRDNWIEACRNAATMNWKELNTAKNWTSIFPFPYTKLPTTIPPVGWENDSFYRSSCVKLMFQWWENKAQLRLNNWREIIHTQLKDAEKFILDLISKNLIHIPFRTNKKQAFYLWRDSVEDFTIGEFTYQEDQIDILFRRSIGMQDKVQQRKINQQTIAIFFAERQLNQRNEVQAILESKQLQINNNKTAEKKTGNSELHGFELYVGEKYVSILLPYLTNNYTNARPRKVAAMLYALKNLKIIQSTFFDNQAELYRALQYTFGNIGALSSFKIAVTNNDPSSSPRLNPDKYKLKIKHEELVISHFLIQNGLESG